MAKFKITWVTDVPEPADFNILGAGIHMVKVPREFSEVVEAEMLEGLLELLNRGGARHIRFQTCDEPKWKHSQGDPTPRPSHYKGSNRG